MKKIFSLTTAIVLIFAALLIPFSVRAAESAADPTEIYTYEDLLKIADDPAGNYALMQDIDMAGLPWKPIPFRGTLEGNGHALLNMNVTEIGDETADTYDGNMKVYETWFAGMFSTLDHAAVSDLNLINFRGTVNADVPCFLGSIAGYSEESTVTGCTVKACLDLTAHDRMFGVGGIIGYGSGAIENTVCDVTLINTDTDVETRDEEFLGGAYGAGYIDLNECTILIDGYVSDHGYVHSGGAVGMFMLYPAGTQHEGYITNNRVTGRITFFEDNKNRRAYCKDYVGEIMNYSYQYGGNVSDFVRDERFEYNVDLRPEMCETPTYTATYTKAGCETYGFTTYQCDNCGYVYTDDYTLFCHNLTDWTVTKEPTVEETGLRSAVCNDCGMTFEEELERLEPAPAPAIEPSESDGAESPEPAKEEPDLVPTGTQPGNSNTLFIIGLIFCSVLIATIVTVKLFRKVFKN